MKNFVFENSTRVYFGRGAVQRYLAEAVKPFGTRILLAYGGGSIRKNGIYEEVLRELKRAGAEVTELPGILPNPTTDMVDRGAELVREHQIDLILGVGGGSVMDCAKAISIAAATGPDYFDRYWAQNKALKNAPVPVGVIETVTGTGSPVNGDSVITDVRRHIKTGHDRTAANPRFAILDPAYTFTVSPFQTAAGGFDALTHVTETYFSGPDDGNLSDGIAEAIMRDIVRNLPLAYADPQNYEARSALMWDSSAAELRLIKLGKNLDFEAHQIEHQLSAFTDCCHGAGLAAIYPAYLRHLLRDPSSGAAGKLARFCAAVFPDGAVTAGGEDQALAERGIRELEKFIKKLGLPRNLRELGLAEADREILPKVAASCEINRGGYHIFTHDEILELLHECW